MKGFSPKWYRWVENFISRGSVSIKVNDDIGHYFQTKKGVRQGDPFSPVLFNIVADMLALLIKRAKNDMERQKDWKINMRKFSDARLGIILSVT